MANMTTYLANEVRKHLLRTGSWSKPLALYVGLIRATRGYSNQIRSTSVSVGDTVIPASPNGRIYRCITAGTTGASEPSWPTTDDGQVADGTAVWTEMYSELEGFSANVTEVSGGGYARQQNDPADANWAGTTAGQSENSVAITYPAPTADWGVIWGWFLADALTAGNKFIYAPLSTPRSVMNNDPAPSFAIGAIDIFFK